MLIALSMMCGNLIRVCLRVIGVLLDLLAGRKFNMNQQPISHGNYAEAYQQQSFIHSFIYFCLFIDIATDFNGGMCTT